MNYLLEEASAKIEHENWSVVNQYLQQLSVSEPNFPHKLTLAERKIILEIGIAVLQQGDFEDRWQITKILPKLGIEIIQPLIAILEDNSAEVEVQEFALRMLTKFDRPEVVIGIVKLLEQTNNEELAEIAAQSLTYFGVSAIQALAELLLQQEYRLLATRTLAQIPRAEVIQPLTQVVQDSDERIRCMAIESLGRFCQPNLIPLFIQALADFVPAVRKEAAIALGYQADLDSKWDLLTYLQPLLYDLNLEVCAQSAIAISKLKSEAAELALFKVLQSPHTPVTLQLNLVKALAWKETKSSLQYLQQALVFTSLEVKLAIIPILGRLEATELKLEAAQILLDFYRSQENSIADNIQLKQALAHAWGHLGSKAAISVLQTLAADESKAVKLHAKAALRLLDC